MQKTNLNKSVKSFGVTETYETEGDEIFYLN